MAVSFTDGVKPHLAITPYDYSDVPRFALAQHASWWGAALISRHDVVKCAEERFCQTRPCTLVLREKSEPRNVGIRIILKYARTHVFIEVLLSRRPYYA